MVSFINPEAFFLLIFFPIIIYFHIKTRNKKTKTIEYSSAHIAKEYFKSALFVSKDLPFILKILSFILIVIALARPATVKIRSGDIGDGIFISFVLDVSPSMLAEDIKPTRLEAAKKTIVNFIKKRQSDKISFITFSSKAYVKCPATTDYESLIEIVEKTENDIDGGTAIGVGMATAIDTLRSMDENTEKIIILFTDGNNNAGEIDPSVASIISLQYGIKIYTIGVGKANENLAWVTVNHPSYGKKRQRVAYMLDEETLIKIANTTGGKYFNAQSYKTLDNIYKTIDKIEKSKIKDDRLLEYNEHYLPFVIAAIALLLIMIILTNTKYITIP